MLMHIDELMSMALFFNWMVALLLFLIDQRRRWFNNWLSEYPHDSLSLITFIQCIRIELVIQSIDQMFCIHDHGEIICHKACRRDAMEITMMMMMIIAIMTMCFFVLRWLIFGNSCNWCTIFYFCIRKCCGLKLIDCCGNERRAELATIMWICLRRS